MSIGVNLSVSTGQQPLGETGPSVSDVNNWGKWSVSSGYQQLGETGPSVSDIKNWEKQSVSIGQQQLEIIVRQYGQLQQLGKIVRQHRTSTTGEK